MAESVESYLWWQRRRRGPTAGRRAGHPLVRAFAGWWHRILVTVPTGALACSFVFDIWSYTTGSPVTGEQFVYARGALVLILVGLIGGAAPPSWTGRPGSPQPFLYWVQSRGDAPAGDGRGAMVAYAALSLLRHRQGSLEPIPEGHLVLMGLAGLGLAGGTWVGAGLVQVHGVGVRRRPGPSRRAAGGDSTPKTATS